MSDTFNIAGLLDQHAVSRARHPAICWHGQVITYGELGTEVRRQANALRAAGIGAGDLVGLCLADTPEHMVMMFALARVGAVFLPLDVRWSPAEINRMVAHFRPRIVLAQHPDVMTTTTLPVVVIDDTWRATVAGMDDDAPITLPADAGLVVSLSSGTTGRPTGPLLRHDQMFARVVSQMASLGFSSAERFMTATPLYFGGGRSFSMSQLMLGATLVLHCPPFTPEKLVQAIRDHEVTSLFLVPTMLRRLLAMEDARLTGLQGLRQLVSSGAPLHIHERDALRRRITPNYFEYYASTEGGGISVLSPADQIRHPASVGRAVFRVEVQVVNDAHCPLPPGQVGAVRYRGSGVANGFFRDPESSRTAFHDGWFYPGDLGEFDVDGFLSLRGRKKDVINRGGVNIYPLEIEQAVATQPDIIEACAFPLPHAELGEEVALACTIRPGVDPATASTAITHHCREALASYKVPARVFILDSLPRNSGGKVVRSQVVAVIGAGGAGLA